MKNFIHSIVPGLAQWLFKESTIRVPSNDVIFSYIVKYSGEVCQSEHLPMLVVLHGDGDIVEDFYVGALDKFTVRARIILIKGPIAHALGRVWPYSAAQFAEYGQAVCEAVDLLKIKYPTVSKPILLGFSGGGAMAYYQAIKHGDSYSYIFPVSGLLFTEQLGDDSSRPGAKVYAYHGKSDDVVPFNAGKKAVKLLRKNGVSVSFTPFKSGHLGIFKDMKAAITQAVEQKLQSL